MAMNTSCDGGWMEGASQCPHPPVGRFNCQSFGSRHLCEEHKWLSEQLCAESERGARAYGRGLEAWARAERAMLNDKSPA